MKPKPKSEDDGKWSCPRCGARMLPVRGKLPTHTKSVDAVASNGRSTKRAEVCQ